MLSNSQSFREIVIGALVTIAILIVAGRQPAHAVLIFNFSGTCDKSATTCASQNLEPGGAVSGFMALDDAAAIPGQTLTPDNFTDYHFEFGKITFQHGPRPLEFGVIYDPPVGILSSSNGISLNATATGFEGVGQFLFRTFPASSFLAAITVESDGTASWFLGGPVFPDGTPGGAGMFSLSDVTSTLPPGLEKHDELPPGLSKKDQLPPRLQKSAQANAAAFDVTKAISIPEPTPVTLLIFGFITALLFLSHKPEPTHKVVDTEQR